MSSPGKKSPPNPVGEGPRTGKRKTGDRETDVALFDDKLWLGRVIDERYRIERMLGEGGMGAVFLAEHLKLQKKVALKIILPQFAGDGEIAERFAREAMASAKLDHPHVASALDYGTLPEGGAYLVMQYVRGRSLRAAAVEHAGDWRFACGIGAQIADALAAAHAAGIVHRDLKPDNVFLEPREGEETSWCGSWTSASRACSMGAKTPGMRGESSSPGWGPSSEPRGTWRPNKPSARRWMSGPTSTRSGSCSGRS
jgi:serine/threonine protein kinase